MQHQVHALEETSAQAVLTGDLVASTEAGPGAIDQAMAELAAAAAGIARWRIGKHSTVGDTKFTRFRGDGWQILVSAGVFGLRAALTTYARLAAKSALPDTRIAVGLSTAERPKGHDLSDAYGAAFTLSGRALSQMERGERLRVTGQGITARDAAFIALLDDRISSWTPEQAEAVAMALNPEAPTQTEMARDLGISPQALSYRLAGARWPTIRRILQEWERPRPPEEALT